MLLIPLDICIRIILKPALCCSLLSDFQLNLKTIIQIFRNNNLNLFFILKLLNNLEEGLKD